MRSPLPSPPTWPTGTSATPESPSTVTKLSVSTFVSVVATRSAPLYSDSENWLRTVPLTRPESRYTACTGSLMSKEWINVDDDGATVWPSALTLSHALVATYTRVGEAY